jgi:hypothetical protein
MYFIYDLAADSVLLSSIDLTHNSFEINFKLPIFIRFDLGGLSRLEELTRSKKRRTEGERVDPESVFSFFDKIVLSIN